MSRQLIGSVVIIALFAAGHPAVAQRTVNDAESWRTFASRLEAGATVEVRLRGGGRVRGMVVTTDAEALQLKPHTRLPEPMRTIPFGDIESIERWREGMMPGTKTLIGIGVGAGAVFFAALIALAASGY